MSGFELTCAGTRVTLPVSAQRLVAFLALRGRPLPRIQAAGSLWPDRPELRSSACLRSALWRARLPGLELVAQGAGQLALSSDVAVDTRRLAKMAGELAGGRADFTRDEVEELIGSGELLPGWYDDWILIERERIRQLRLHSLELLCDRLASGGRFAEAVQAGLAAVETDPLRDSAHEALIRAFLMEGNRWEAQRQFDAYADVIKVELGLEPSPAIAQLAPIAGRR
jgi:DNA-binding SARP family transcriptional activator